MATRNGNWCCECDYCDVSECDGKGAFAIFLTDYPQTFNYYQFCGNHRDSANIAVRGYLGAHPGVLIDIEE